MRKKIFVGKRSREVGISGRIGNEEFNGRKVGEWGRTSRRKRRKDRLKW